MIKLKKLRRNYMDNLNVEKPVKKTLKTMFKTLENFVKTYQILLFNVYKISFQSFFQTFSTDFYTIIQPLFLTNIFHYSTDPTITTTIYYINRRKD